MSWVFLRHEETGGAGLYTEDPGLLTLLESRGWTRHALPEGIDPDDPYAPGALAEVLAEGIQPEPILSEEQVDALKGKELDAALEAAGLSKSGTADERRARLAEYEAELATNNSNEEEGVTGG
jgi:hypothetical protein